MGAGLDLGRRWPPVIRPKVGPDTTGPYRGPTEALQAVFIVYTYPDRGADSTQNRGLAARLTALLFRDEKRPVRAARVFGVYDHA